MSRVRQTSGFLLIVSLLAAAGASEADGTRASDGTRLAVLAATGRHAPSEVVVAELEVALSKHEGVALVERAEVATILREQQLTVTGLTDPATAARVGQLLSAQLVLCLEKIPKARPPACRLQLIETQTGIVLATRLTREKDVRQNMTPVLDFVTRGVARSRVPLSDRCCVAFLGLRNEEPGGALDGLARALEVFLMTDLAASPKVVALDREHLSRLVDESNLSGIDLTLKNAVVVLDGGLRRIPGTEELAITLVFRRLTERPPETLKLAAPAKGLSAVRTRVTQAVVKELGTGLTGAAALDAREEAVMFADRGELHLLNGNHEAAVRAAEAALALAPSQKTREITVRAWRELADERVREWRQAGAKGYLAGSIESMPPGRKIELYGARLREWSLLHEIHRAHAEAFEQGRARTPMLPPACGQLPSATDGSDSDGPRVADLRRQLAQVMLEVWRFRLQFYGKHRHDAKWWHYYWEELGQSYRLDHGQPERQAERFRRVVDEFLHTLSPPQLRVKNPYYALWCWSWAIQPENRDLSYQRAFAPLCQEFSQHRDPFVRLIAYHAIMRSQPEYIDSAKAILATVADGLPPSHPYRAGHAGGDNPVIMECVAVALSRLAGQRCGDDLARGCEQVFAPLVEARDAKAIIAWYQTLVMRVLRYFDLARSPVAGCDLVGRLIAALEEPRGEYDPKAVERMKILLRNEQLKLMKKSGAELEADPAWEEYTFRGLDLHPTQEGEVRQLVVGGDCCYSVHENDDRVSVCSIALPDGRRRRVLGTVHIPGLGDRRRFSRVTSAVLAGKVLYVGTQGGLAIFTAGKGRARVLTEEQGLPANGICALAWYQERLYLGLSSDAEGHAPGKSGFASFNPATEKFTLLASSASAAPANDFDGGGRPYTVGPILVDRERECLWFHAKHNGFNEKERRGIWQFRPSTGQFVRLRNTSARPVGLRQGKLLVLISPEGLYSCDPADMSLSPLFTKRLGPPVDEAEGQPLYGASWSRYHTFAFDGDRLITVGQLPGSLYLHRIGAQPAFLPEVPGLSRPSSTLNHLSHLLPTPHGILLLGNRGRDVFLIARKGTAGTPAPAERQRRDPVTGRETP